MRTQLTNFHAREPLIIEDDSDNKSDDEAEVGVTSSDILASIGDQDASENGLATSLLTVSFHLRGYSDTLSRSGSNTTRSDGWTKDISTSYLYWLPSPRGLQRPETREIGLIWRFQASREPSFSHAPRSPEAGDSADWPDLAPKSPGRRVPPTPRGLQRRETREISWIWRFQVSRGGRLGRLAGSGDHPRSLEIVGSGDWPRVQ
ncbi:hypothetical protein VE03_01528 [Pseudogymnoascus sp. 23342-1-I1]|nr:hypothetical protein VE03_01528 [Pseudogymnoascus sp. 23342-1-I1]